MLERAGIFIDVNSQPLEVDLLPRVHSSEFGAQAFFIGTIRKQNHGRVVTAVTYDIHPSLCENRIAAFAEEARETWGVLKIFVQHRLGRVKVDEASVVVAVGSPHRTESCQALIFMIEKIKHEVPIWKCEHYEDGTSEWSRGCTLKPLALS